MASQYFEEVYVKIAEATANSRDALTGAVEPLSDTANYNSTGLAGNVKTVVDIQTNSATDGFTETTISETQFEIDNLIPANSTWTQMQDLAQSNTPYNAIVTALNNFVVANVLSKASLGAYNGSTYQTTLQLFLDLDCNWDSDPSAGAGSPTAWINLMQAAGFDVIDTHPDNA